MAVNVGVGVGVIVGVAVNVGLGVGVMVGVAVNVGVGVGVMVGVAVNVGVGVGVMVGVGVAIVGLKNRMAVFASAPMLVYVIVSKSVVESSQPTSAWPLSGLLLAPYWKTKLPSSFKMT